MVDAPVLEDGWLSGLAPVLDDRTRILILGSFPGRASLAAGNYYAHPRNALWPILGQALGVELQAMAFEDRYARILAAGIGLWDVVDRCQRKGSLDSAMRQPRESLAGGLGQEVLGRLTQLERVLFNGKTAARIGRRIDWEAVRPGVVLVDLPSTSPAYASIAPGVRRSAWVAGLGVESHPSSPGAALTISANSPIKVGLAEP